MKSVCVFVCAGVCCWLLRASFALFIIMRVCAATDHTPPHRPLWRRDFGFYACVRARSIAACVARVSGARADGGGDGGGGGCSGAPRGAGKSL